MEHTESECVLGESTDEGSLFNEDGGYLSENDFDDAVVYQTTAKQPKADRLTIRQNVGNVSGTFVGVKIDRIG